MSISKKFEFDRVMKFALGNESSDGMYINEAAGIEDILDAPIEHINVAFLSGGRDHHGAQTVEQHDSLHAVLYLHVYQARQAQLGMENSESAPKVAVSPGVLTVKFQALRGNAYASVLNLKCKWNDRGFIKTLRHFLLMIYHIDGSNS